MTAIIEPTNTDRIALSNHLYELAEEFTAEADRWTAENAKAECERIARLLAEIARGVLSGAANYAKAEAFREAATVIAAHVIGARRFFDALRAPGRGE